jgi:VCBS repeat-containing protein
VTNNGDGTFGYDPNGQFEYLAAGEQAFDTFTYVVSDSVLTDTATVTITVNGVNDAPVANDDSGVGFTTDEETAFTTGSVLDNDSDPDTSDTLSVHSINTIGTAGQVTNNHDGTFNYDPNGQFEYLAVGEQAFDTFTYIVSDSVLTDTATVTITVNGVNDAPTANDDGYTTDEDTPFTTGSVLTNDTDPDTSDTLSVDSFDDSSTLGLVTNNGDGTFDYDPNGQFEWLAVGEQATDVFTYTVTDSNGGFDTAVTITVNGVNDAPVANDDSGAGFITDEDTPFTTGSVLDNDTDAESDPLSVDSFDDSSTLGLVTGGSGGTFDYDPNGQFEWLAVGEVAYDTFQYTVSDGVLTDTATVTITVNGVNDAPTISDIPDQTTSSNTPVGPTGFTVGDVDTPAASLTLSAESSNTTLVPLSNITFGGSGASRTVTVTPTGTLVDETVTITVTVDDGMDTDSDTFTLTVEPLRIYLPLVMKNYVVAPDLVVEDIIATSNDVQVVIKNQGNAPTTEGFWVDVYINPSPIPTGVNQTWDMLGDEGLIWGVAVPLQPGEVITLTIGDQYYQPLLSHILWPLAVGTPIYAQVDSFNPATTYGTVRESHEMTGGPYNNITGDTVQAD